MGELCYDIDMPLENSWGHVFIHTLTYQLEGFGSTTVL